MTTDLKTLTVLQLKALCKEKGITGYSKLAKSALLEKLAGHICATQNSVAPASVSVSASVPGNANVNATSHGSDANISILPTASISKTKTATTTGTAKVTKNKNKIKEKVPTLASSIIPIESVTTSTTMPVATELNNSTGTGDNSTSAITTALQITIPVSQTTTIGLSSSKPTNHPHSNAVVAIPSNNTTGASVQVSGSRMTGYQEIEMVTRRQSTPPHLQAPVKPKIPISGLGGEEEGRNVDEPPRKKQRLDVSKNTPVSQTLVLATRSIPVVIRPRKGINESKKGEQGSNPKKVTNDTVKRFIKLVPKARIPSAIAPTAPVPIAPPTQLQQDCLDTCKETMSTQFGDLDFVSTDETNLEFKTITFPPSLTQRKYASRLAIILRDISISDIKALSLSSRLLRYSAYLSAAYHLKRWYAGRRLENVLTLKGLSIDRMNLWFYRIKREDEKRKRKEIFLRSWLGFLLGRESIDEGIWASGDSERQAAIAVRFLLTWCYFEISLNRGLEDVKKFKVVGVELVMEEIWCVSVASRKSEHFAGMTGPVSTRYYVLEDTCEIIGSPVSVGISLPTRLDWSVYIQKYEKNKSLGIMNNVRWTNHEEYDKGVSKIWLKRIEEEGVLGAMKKNVARRYILACTMGNSLSGRYMNSSEMEQELNGLPRIVEATIHRRKEPRVNLFVPAHHHVESVHFMTASKQALHPAIAVIQTPSREYYILRDNGMQIGCEEEGIARIWMEVIGCKTNGTLVM